jgi:hypothetical protein
MNKVIYYGWLSPVQVKNCAALLIKVSPSLGHDIGFLKEFLISISLAVRVGGDLVAGDQAAADPAQL